MPVKYQQVDKNEEIKCIVDALNRDSIMYVFLG